MGLRKKTLLVLALVAMAMPSTVSPVRAGDGPDEDKITFCAALASAFYATCKLTNPMLYCAQIAEYVFEECMLSEEQED